MSDIFLNFITINISAKLILTKYEKTVISIGKSAKCDIVINSDALNDKEVILKKEDGV